MMKISGFHVLFFNSVQFNSALDSTCLFSDRYKTKQPALITAI